MLRQVLQKREDNDRSQVTEEERRYGIQGKGLDVDTAMMLNTMELKTCRVWILNAVLIRIDGGKPMVTASIVSVNVITENDGKAGRVGDLRREEKCELVISENRKVTKRGMCGRIAHLRLVVTNVK